MREIVLDTETTGLDPTAGHRVVEIACLELLNHIPTGRHFQRYVNPEREVPADAIAVHGLSAEFLGDKPRFAEIADELLSFIGEAPVVIHNAEFDIGFLNAEFVRLDRSPFPQQRIVDTLVMARQKFPGAPASLDALCRRFAIDNTTRTKHGALLDTELIASVYLELIGGRQAGLELSVIDEIAVIAASGVRTTRLPRPHAPTEAELAAHLLLVAQLSDPIWSY
jgi:DNA polymerase-3 subunit epsilon